MKLELHTHSWYSKGDVLGEESAYSPVELVKEARRKGLDGIAITDHDSFKSWESLKNLKLDNFIIIPGEEVSTAQGHLIALGINEEIKPRQNILETIDKIHQQGGIAIAPHPFDVAKEGIRNFSKFADAIEVVNSMNIDKFANLRAERFARKLNKSMTAGSDAHSIDWIGRSSTIINSELNLDSVLKEIKLGHTEIQKGYLNLNELLDWYLNRLNLHYFQAIEHIDSNYGFFRRNMVKKLINYSGRDTLFSRGLVASLSYLSFITATTYSFFTNCPRCLI